MLTLVLLACAGSPSLTDSAAPLPKDGTDPQSPGEPPLQETAVPTDTGTEPPAPSWDTDPPDGPAGTEAVVEIACSLLVDPVQVTFRKTDDPWLWEVGGVSGNVRLPGLDPCYAESGGNGVVLWEPAPRISLVSGSMMHSLEPGIVEDTWFGTVLPMAGSSSACDTALEEAGLEWPIHLSMVVLEVRPADGAELGAMLDDER